QLKLLISELEKSRVLVFRPNGKVEIDRRHTGAALRIILVGKLLNTTMKEVEDLIRNYRINDAIVRISGEVSLDDVEDAIFETTTYKPAVIVANKLDMKVAENNLNVLKKFVNGK